MPGFDVSFKISGSALNWFSIICGFITIYSLIYAVHTTYKTNKLLKEKRNLSWDDIQIAIKSLSKLVNRNFVPEVIFAFDSKGAIIAELLCNHFKNPIPLFVGTSLWKEGSNSLKLSGYTPIETNKWFLNIPNAIFKYKTILIVHDFTMSGDYITKTRNILISKGFQTDNIRFLSIVVTDVAISNHQPPDFYWSKRENDDFYFPWGKAR